MSLLASKMVFHGLTAYHIHCTQHYGLLCEVKGCFFPSMTHSKTVNNSICELATLVNCKAICLTNIRFGKSAYLKDSIVQSEYADAVFCSGWQDEPRQERIFFFQIRLSPIILYQ